MPENISKPAAPPSWSGIGLALLILFLAFGSFVAAGLPIGVALVGLGIGSGGVTLLAALTDVTTIAPTLASMIGIGVGVDYALFIVTRHRDALARGLSVPDAAPRPPRPPGSRSSSPGAPCCWRCPACCSPAYRTSGPWAMPRDSSCCSSWPPRSPCCRRCSAWPGCGSTAARPAAPRTSRRPRRTRRPPPGWRTRWPAKPVAWMVGSTVLLLALAAPALGMKLGNADAGNEAESTTIRQAYDLVTDGFGPGANAPCWSRWTSRRSAAPPASTR
jgi:RND superfamily putative drug exporter